MQCKKEKSNKSINIYSSKNHISITLQEGMWLSVAEISIYNDNFWYFNRLNVPKKIRGRGISKILMEKLVEILDCKGIDLLLTINPYGGMSYEQLVNFYKKFGFVSAYIDEIPCYLRKHKQNIPQKEH